MEIKTYSNRILLRMRLNVSGVTIIYEANSFSVIRLGKLGHLCRSSLYLFSGVSLYAEMILFHATYNSSSAKILPCCCVSIFEL